MAFVMRMPNEMNMKSKKKRHGIKKRNCYINIWKNTNYGT